MLKQNRGKIILTTLITLLPMVAGLCLWSFLPDRVPTHWNFAGEIDGWSSKAFAVFGLPGIIVACHLLCVLITAADPKHQNVSGKMLNMVYWITPIVSIVVGGATYMAAFGLPFRMELVGMILMGVMFIVLGNWLPKCQPNYTVGIKLPWTIHDEDNWRKTHRFAGPVWVAGGVVLLLTSFLGEIGLYIMVADLILLAVIPTVYSFMLYRRTYQ